MSSSIDELFERVVSTVGPPAYLSPVARWEELRRRLLLLVLGVSVVPLVVVVLVLLYTGVEYGWLVALILVVMGVVETPVMVFLLLSIAEERLRTLLQLVEYARPSAWSIAGRIMPRLAMIVDGVVVGSDGQHYTCLCMASARAVGVCVPAAVYLARLLGPMMATLAAALIAIEVLGETSLVPLLLLVVLAATLATIAYAARSRIEHRTLCVDDPVAPGRRLQGRAVYMYRLSASPSDTAVFLNMCRSVCSEA